jgi:serine/threonine protein kinase
MSETCPKDNMEGQTIDGRWQVLAKLGEGATSKVYLVRDNVIDREVALKILNEYGSTEDKVYKRFSREIRNLGKLSHENIIRQYTVGVFNNRLYMVTDYVEGRTLQSLIANEELELDRIVSIGSQIASALIEAHGCGVVHRDIKPSNVYLVQSDRPDRKELVKLLDFGMSRLQEALLTDTQTNSFCGTPNYMSPEQCQGTRVDHRTDIYSLGCLLYELVTGQPPFAGETSFELLQKHIHVTPPVITDCRYPGLVDIIMRCLEKRPEDRYQSASEVQQDLAQCHLRRFRTNNKKRILQVAKVCVVLLCSLVGVRFLWSLRPTSNDAIPKDQLTMRPADRPEPSPLAQRIERQITRAENQAKDRDLDSAYKTYEDAYNEASADRDDSEVQKQRIRIGEKMAVTALEMHRFQDVINITQPFCSMKLVTRTDDEKEVAYTKVRRAQACMELHRFEEARKLIDEAEAFFAKYRFYDEAASVAANKLNIPLLEGRFNEIRPLLEKPLSDLRRCENKETIPFVNCVDMIAIVAGGCENAKQHELAEECFEQDWKVAALSKLARSRLLSISLGLAHMYALDKNVTKQTAMYDYILRNSTDLLLQDLPTAQQHDVLLVRAQAAAERAQIFRLNKQFNLARDRAIASITALEQADAKDYASGSFMLLGTIRGNMGNLNDETNLDEKAVEFAFETTAKPKDMAEFMAALADAYLRNGRPKESATTYTEAVKYFSLAHEPLKANICKDRSQRITNTFLKRQDEAAQRP